MKKKSILLFLLSLYGILSNAQDTPTFDSQSIRLGFAIGPSFNLAKTYSSTLSPDLNALQIQKNSPVSLKLSTSLVYNRNHNWQKLDKDGNPIGDPYKYPGKLSYVAALNIAELSNGGLGLNKSIDGGIGLGLRIDPNFHVIGLFELTSNRQIRDYLRNDFENKSIPSGKDQVLNALDESDNRFFFSKPVAGFSLRFIYVFGKGTANIDNSKPLK